MARTQFPGIPGGIESFQTWDVADWGLGCDIRDDALALGRLLAVRPVALGAAGT
jgi:hypothetical protein